MFLLKKPQLVSSINVNAMLSCHDYEKVSQQKLSQKMNWLKSF